jgi:hypothetical protein
MGKPRFLTYATITLLSWQLFGCGERSDPSAAKLPDEHKGEPDHDHEEGHSHGSGPHEGALFDWGGGAYHVEFTVDHDKKKTTVYILGSDEKSPAPIKAERITLTLEDPVTEIELTAAPLDGETGGVSSRFVGVHDNLGVVKEFAGSVSGEVEGTPYYGDFKEGAHTH